MSNKIQDMAWEAPVPRAYKFVLVALAHYASHEGICFPTITAICAKTSSSERTVQAAVSWLEATKCITVERQPGQRNVWRIHPQRFDPAPEGK